jgi:hypothetical protein
MRIVQVRRDRERRVAIVHGSSLRLLGGEDSTSVYTLANQALARGERLKTIVEKACGGETLDYEAVYQGSSEWRCRLSITRTTYRAVWSAEPG